MSEEEINIELVYASKLKDYPPETWMNSVFSRLGVATGLIPVGFGYAFVDVDEVLEEAERLIFVGLMHEAEELNE